MNKYPFKSILSAAIACTLGIAPACQREECPAPDGMITSFSATIDIADEDKAKIDVSSRKVSWENGDQIKVSNGT